MKHIIREDEIKTQGHKVSCVWNTGRAIWPKMINELRNYTQLFTCSTLSQDLITVTRSITTVKHTISAAVYSHSAYWL